jgi:curli biogenesis system outer membrane secretion channel CsgG
MKQALSHLAKFSCSAISCSAISYSAISCSTLLWVGFMAALPLTPIAMASEMLAQSQPQSRVRVAVLDFDYASTGADYWWYANPDAAKGVSDLLTNKLVNSGRYTMIERSRIADILAEQNLAAAGRIDSSTAAQIGRVLGADVVVIGSVTRFNLDEEGGGASILGFGGSGSRRTAEVELTARIVNTTTAEIVAAAEGSGSESEGSGRVSISIFGSAGRSANNDDELLSGAAEEAVTQLASQLTDAASKLSALPATLPTIDATVADVAGNTVIINRGTQDGFRSGMRLSIERVDREVLDPQTGEVLRTITTPIGQVELTEVDARSGVGRVVSGIGFQVGDKAKAVQ